MCVESDGGKCQADSNVHVGQNKCVKAESKLFKLHGGGARVRVRLIKQKRS